MLNAAWALWWLHPPKTGTSFRDSVLDYPWSAYRDTTWPQGCHQVLGLDMTDRIQRPGAQVVAMFRQPEDRLVSAYFHMRDLLRKPRSKGVRGLPRLEWPQSPVGCCWKDWGWEPSVFVRVHKDVAAAVPPERALARFTGCMTNMVLGYGCMSQHATSPADARRAVEQRLRHFLFVGDQGQWNMSLCLFNAIMTGRRFVLPRQLANSRPTSTKLLDPANPAGSAIATRDPIDGELWNYVQRRFRRDVRRHGVSPECCPVTSDPTALPQLGPSGCTRYPLQRRPHAPHSKPDFAPVRDFLSTEGTS